MADAIDNLAQDLNQANAVDEFPGYPGYKMGDLVPNMAGVRVGDLFYGYDPYGQEAPYNWRTGGFEYQAAPSDVGFGNIDYNIRDQPTERINIGNTDEQDALIRTGIGTPLNPVTQQIYNTTGTTPSPVGGVDYLTPKQIEDLTAGQTPSVPQGVVTRGEPVSIPGRTIPDYIPIGQMENGDVLYADRNNIRDTIIRPSAYSVSQEDLDKGVVPQKFDFGVNTAPSTSQVTPTPVESYQSVGAVEPTTTSVGGFDNTGGDVTVGPGVAGPSVDDTIRFNPDYKPKPEVQPGDEFKDSPYRIFDPTGKDDKLADYTSPTGEVFPTDQNGYKWNYKTQQFDCVGGKCSEKNPVEDTTKPPVVNPPTGGGQPPTGGTKPGGVITGAGIGTYTGTPIPTREPVTPLVRREVVIPTKGTKEVPLPDRQADPFAKLYADLLANSQQQEDRYRYINYDPDQIMNAAMSGFRRRGAMRSLQGY
ncbi:MAG: hypothetical protein JW384_02387 [Nitrosomonadaceae bacterium]|nr:hypothetical protein [Nitrosomonadaceae bacterium]